MATNNGINASSQGTLYYNGTGTVSGVDGGTAGHVLTSNGTGVAPSFQASGGGSGSIVGSARTTSTTPVHVTSSLAYSAGTTPTTSNTQSILTLSYTPTNSSNILLFNLSIPYLAVSSSSGSIGFFLFSGSTLISSFPLVAGNSVSQINTAVIDFYKAAGTTSATTYGLYAASNTSSNFYILEDVGAGTYYNSTSAITFVITEVTP